jgi:hypothetical protein
VAGRSHQKLHFEFDALPPLTQPWRQLGTRGVALGLLRLPAGKGYSFSHSHAEQAEVCLVLDGRGELCADGELQVLDRGGCVRVDPRVRRALRAAANEPRLLACFGGLPAGCHKDANARHGIDGGIPHYDNPPPWAANDPRSPGQVPRTSRALGALAQAPRGLRIDLTHGAASARREFANFAAPESASRADGCR